MDDPVILSACRTPIGSFLGDLSPLSATGLGAVAVREAVQRSGIAPEQVDEAIMGNVLSAGLGQAPARQAALGGGIPPTASAVTINKMCGSGLKAVMLAAQAVRLGDAEVVVAGGMESMSRAPHLLVGARRGWKFGDQTAVDSMLCDGLVCAMEGTHMGLQAEYIARLKDVSREDQDRLALASHQRAAAAIESGAFEREIVGVELSQRRTTKTVRVDQGPRPDTTIEKLARLPTIFETAGTVTAGNASQLSDGAAAVVVCSQRLAKTSGTRPLARIVAYAAAGIEPKELFIAPVLAVRKVLDRAGLTVGDMDLIELNEAFAAQMLACTRPLELPPEKVNVDGGAIALGHPIGASGARLLVTLLHALERRDARRGLVSLCLGGGGAVAMIVERLD